MNLSIIFKTFLFNSSAIVGGILLAFSSTVATAEDTRSVQVSAHATTPVTPVQVLSSGSTEPFSENSSVAAPSPSIQLQETVELSSQAPVADTNSTDILLKTAQQPDEAEITQTDVPSEEPVTPYSEIENPQNDPMGQVTNVTQLGDVRPTDWAYEALRSLVERYGCIAGYPDGSFRGNRAMTRYEFAAGLNSCLQQLERLIQTSAEGAVTKRDLETLQRLTDEFRSELTALGTRVDTLEGRVAFLEDRQFSTTTKLVGEAIFGVADAFGDDVDDQVNTVLHDRVRLN
ncbi:MAG TPA: iron uptake porin, partial [Coleofasciculaceae cyanobacterium]